MSNQYFMDGAIMDPEETQFPNPDYLHQKQQEERQEKILEALECLRETINCAWNGSDRLDSSLRKQDFEYLDFLANECGIGDQWRKRNGN